jgi:hypothetical protein
MTPRFPQYFGMRPLFVSALILLAVSAFAQAPAIYARSAIFGVGGGPQQQNSTNGGPISTAVSGPYSSVQSSSSWGNIRTVAVSNSPNEPRYRGNQVATMGNGGYWDMLTISNPALDGQQGWLSYKIRVTGNLIAEGGADVQAGFVGPNSNTARIIIGTGESAPGAFHYDFSRHGDGTTSGADFLNQTIVIREGITFGQPMHLRIYLTCLTRAWGDYPGYVLAEAANLQFEGIASVTDGNNNPVSYTASSLGGQPWGVGSPSFTLALNKSTVAGQNYVQGNIALSEPAASGVVFTTYDDSSLVTTPATVTVASGQINKLFAIQVTAVNSPINATIYAKRGVVTRSSPLTLTPLIPTALAFTPSTVTGGNQVMCRVVINGVAGPSGRTIAVFDNSPFTTMPSTVTVPPGGTEVTFPITTTAVTSQKIVTVTARVSAGEKTGTFRINP